MPDTSDTNVTRVRYERQSETQVQHECYTDDTSAERVKNFDSDMSKNNFFKQHYNLSLDDTFKMYYCALC